VCGRAVFRPQKFVFRLRNARVFDVLRRVRVLEIQSCWSAAESADVRLHRDAKDTRVGIGRRFTKPKPDGAAAGILLCDF